MKIFKEYSRYDATGLAELVRKKKVSPEELRETAIDRIEKLNPRLNAVVTPMFDLAREAAKKPLPKGPFTGVPLLLKDLLAAYAGVPLTSGSRAYRDYVPDHDSELVRRFKNAGLIVLGKTNTPEFGLVAYTEPELFGPARNPWDTDRTPGGSSGGSAAAVAAGMVPFASGGDGGGSIRIPSAYCGLFGLKPSRGRVPTGRYHGEIWQGAAVEHVLTRSVRDSAAVLDATRGSEPGAPYIIQAPEAPYIKEILKKPGKLKIGYCTRSPIGTVVEGECVRAVEDAAKLLRGLGHVVEEAEPAVDGLALAKAYMMMYFGEVAAEINRVKQLTGVSAGRDTIEAVTWTLGLLGRTFSAGDFAGSMDVWNSASRAMGDYFEHYDLYMTPTTASIPPKIGELKPKGAEAVLMKVVNALGAGTLMKLSGIVDKLAVESLAIVPFTQMVNLTGLPAMSVPLHWTAENMPVGVHFVAPFGDEATLFRLAAQLEKAKPWFNKRPDISGL
ncbi:MAG TPA: amidase [Spirochaetes bacterium]|nr:amidase [Spirochaetota bacterium]